MHLFLFLPSSLLYSADEEFDELCFEFGLELDEVVRCAPAHVRTIKWNIPRTNFVPAQNDAYKPGLA